MTVGGACTLRAAIMEANATPAPDTIVVPNGVYVLQLGEVDITSPITIQGLGLNKTIIDGGNTGNWDGTRVFDVARGPSVLMRSLTVRNGYVDKDGESGGCIRNAGKLTLDTVAVTKCQTSCNDWDWSEPICDGGAIANNGILSLQESEVSDSSSSWYAAYGASRGGGIFNAPKASLTITRSTIARNTAALEGYFMGGGVYNRGYMEVDQSTFQGNDASSAAAIFNDAGATAKLSGSTFSGNTIFIYVFDATILNAGTMTITNCTISGNEGAIRSGDDLAIQNSTIYGNEYSGGLWAGPKATVKNTIIAGNTHSDFGDPGTNPNCNTFTSLGYNLIGDPKGCTFARGPGDMVNRNPVLGPLNNNGGKTKTHALLPASPAIDAGSPAALGTKTACETIDQRGVERPQNYRCDIGASERKVGLGGGR